jgi:cytochrome P450
VTVKYVTDYFTVVGQLRQWPASIRPIAHYFNPLSRACKQGMSQVRAMLREEEVRRRAAKASGAIFNDAIEWTSAAAGDKDIDQAALQLGLAIAALFTTSEALRQTVVELCKNTDIVPAIREEIQQAISEFGWTMSALFKMKLLDSVMKESQRTLPPLGMLQTDTCLKRSHPS